MRHSKQTSQPLDGPAPPHTPIDKREQTGLLTRFVPDRLKAKPIYRWFLRFTRLLQLISSVVSLALFSKRLYKVYRLVNRIKAHRGVNGSYGAVEGILAAAVAYTLITTLLGLLKKSANPGGRVLRWLWVLADLAFVGAFIAVTVLTRPNGGLAGARHCYTDRISNVANGNTSAASGSVTGQTASQDDSCNLPWGTFVLAIFSTLLHAITASFNEIKDYRRRNRIEEEKAIHNADTR